MRRTIFRSASFAIAPNVPFQLFDGGKKNLPALNTTVDIDNAKLLKMLHDMHYIRRLEMLSDQAYKAKKIRGFCHLYTGQEAVAVGMEHILDYNDALVTAYRDHAWHITRGGTAFEVFAEMFGKHKGMSKGKGGSMHMYNVKNNFYGGNGIVGAQVPIGVGLGFTFAYKNGVDSPKHVAVTLYGDGASNQGQIYEVFNMAALHRVPVIFVCENNHFGMGTAVSRASANPSFHNRAEYIPGLVVDGMNLFAVVEATRWAKSWCLAGNGPVILEMDTYRYVGHSMSDPGSSYRTKEQVDAVRSKRDCITQLKESLITAKIATAEDIAKIEKQVKSEIDSELAAASAAEDAHMEEQFTDILIGEQFPVRTCQGSVFKMPPVKA